MDRVFVLIEEYDGELGVVCKGTKKECSERLEKQINECLSEDYLFEDFYTSCCEHYIPSRDENRIRDNNAGYDVAGWTSTEGWYDGGVCAQWKVEEL